MGSREGAVAKIDTDVASKIEGMLKALDLNKDFVINDILSFVYNIKPKVHKNYLLKLSN